jgi:hypothetical protein
MNYCAMLFWFATGLAAGPFIFLGYMWLLESPFWARLKARPWRKRPH